MKTAFNTMFKNEERLFSEILKTWITYPIDLFVFYDDNSTDSSIDIIKKFIPVDRFIIINDKLDKFNESYQRQRMIDISKQHGVDIVFSIDCDELLTSNIIKNWGAFLEIYNTTDAQLYWFNCVNNSLEQYRTDPQYKNNYRSFVLPLKHIGRLNPNDWKYHTPRTPHINLPKVFSKQCGVIHLQAVNRRYYAIKQLWYKHYEYVKYNHTVEFINSRYDAVVNNLNFEEKNMDKKLIENIDFDISVFDNLEKDKGYLDFIHKHYNKLLITFGEEYI